MGACGALHGPTLALGIVTGLGLCALVTSAFVLASMRQFERLEREESEFWDQP